jgi:hypothetical protein
MWEALADIATEQGRPIIAAIDKSIGTITKRI